MSKYFDFLKRMSFNAFIYFLVGGRGIGKTYGAKVFAVNKAIRKGEKFIWLRRYQKELDLGYLQFFDDIKSDPKFEKYEFSVKRQKMIHLRYREKVAEGEKENEWQIAGYMIALTQFGYLKSIPLPNFRYIFFDEYLIENKNSRYLKDEGNMIMSIAETVFRDFNYPNNKIIFLANNVTQFDPHKVYHDIPLTSDLFRTEDIYYEVIRSSETQQYFDDKVKTRQGRLIRKTEYGKVSIDNETIITTDFVGKKKGHHMWWFNIGIKGEIYGVWRNPTKDEDMYISRQIQSSTERTFITDIDTHRVGMHMTGTSKKLFHIKFIIAHYKSGTLRYEDTAMQEQIHNTIGKWI